MLLEAGGQVQLVRVCVHLADQQPLDAPPPRLLQRLGARRTALVGQALAPVQVQRVHWVEAAERAVAALGARAVLLRQQRAPRAGVLQVARVDGLLLVVRRRRQLLLLGGLALGWSCLLMLASVIS